MRPSLVLMVWQSGRVNSVVDDESEAGSFYTDPDIDQEEDYLPEGMLKCGFCAKFETKHTGR